MEEFKSESILMDAHEIKLKVLSGEYKISSKRGRSKVWNIFGYIDTDRGVEVPEFVFCRSCKNVYKFNKKTTSNLVKHKCYVNAELKNKIKLPQTVADVDTKQIALDLFTKWAVINCREFKIVNDSGLKEIANFFVSVGAKFGENVDVRTFIPAPTKISKNIEAMYKTKLEEIKYEISTIIETGYGLTLNLWTDNFLKKTFLSLTIHFIKDNNSHCRLLGMESINDERNTSNNMHAKVVKLLTQFGCNLDNKAIIVTDIGSNMVSAFQSYNHLFCIDHLLQNVIKRSMDDVDEIANMCSIGSKIVRYIKKPGNDSNFTTNLKNYSPTRRNTFYYLFKSIRNNWNEILKILQEKNELHRLGELNFSLLNSLIEILEKFEEALKKLEDENCPTLHLVIVYIDKLLRTCEVKNSDILICKLFKEKLLLYLETIVLQNLNIYHKIALFLFPPANKLLQFKDEEKEAIRNVTKEMMSEFISHQSINVSGETISQDNSELFGRFVFQKNFLQSSDMVDEELIMYENTIITFSDNFDILKWWDTNENQFPLLYKVSCRVLAVPATSAASERIFFTGRSLLTEKRCSLGGHSDIVSKIMFLNQNNSF